MKVNSRAARSDGDIRKLEQGATMDDAANPAIVGHIGIKKQPTLGVTPGDDTRHMCELLGARARAKRRPRVQTFTGLRCYYRRDLTKPNGQTRIRLYFKDERGYKQRLELSDATTASWIQPGVYYTLEQITDAPKKKQR